MNPRTSQDVTMTDATMSNNLNDMTAMSEEASSSLSLSQDIREEEMYPRWTLQVLGLFAQASNQAEAETAYLRLLPSIVDAEPESYGCDLFLMSSDTMIFKISDKHHLYLYKDGLNQFFYDIGEPAKRHYLTGEPAKIILKNANFTQAAENPVKCEDEKICDVVLKITSRLGHTQSYTPDKTKLAAIAILKRHPELLFRTSKSKVIEDHHGRKTKGSPYRLLWATGDPWALKQVHESIMPNIENGEAIAQDEFKKQFPDYKGSWPLDPNMPEEMLYDERNKKQIEDVRAQLEIIAEKITADPCTNVQATLDETTKAVEKLLEIFAPKKGEIIETGLHFPLGIMKEIGKVYDAHLIQWNADQLAFFSRCVIGPATAALSRVDGQCCKNGLSNLNMAQGPDRQDGLFCPRPKGIPPDLAPLVGKLGRTMFVDPYDGYSCFLTSNPGCFDWYNKNGSALLHLADVGVVCGDCLPRSVGQLMENKSRDYSKLLCGNTKRSQHSVSMIVTNRGNA